VSLKGPAANFGLSDEQELLRAIAGEFVAGVCPAEKAKQWDEGVGGDAQRQLIRDEVMTGRRRLAVALSEPDSGSDAAALRASAQDQGDHFLVNGQKMWCTGAGLPETTIATYVRTGPREPKHEGISLLLIDPQAEGVEVRRTPTLAGTSWARTRCSCPTSWCRGRTSSDRRARAGR
jgi:hypothetical protein